MEKLYAKRRFLQFILLNKSIRQGVINFGRIGNVKKPS